MTDDRFRELVNLYLDREISAPECAQLKAELASSEARRREFEKLSRLHKAMMLALGSSLDASGPRGEAPNVVRLRRWTIGLGAAACFLIGASLAVSWTMMEQGESAMVESGRVVGEPVDEAAVVPSAIRRYHASLRVGQTDGTSLAAQLRLSGLSPEIVPVDRELTAVDLAQLQAGESDRERIAELFERLQSAQPMPAPSLVEFPESTRAEQENRWPGGFQTSLASFQ